jgi:hypothetical protein
MPNKEWVLDMLAEPIVPPFTTKNRTNTNGAELQKAILVGFSNEKNAIWVEIIRNLPLRRLSLSKNMESSFVEL